MDEPLREYISDRLRTALRTVERKVRSVTLRIGQVATDSDANKPYCAVTARLNGGATVTTVDLGDELRATIDRAVDKLACAVERHLKSHWW